MSSEQEIDLLHEMLRIRIAEEKIAELYPEQEMRCPIHLCVGQEAIAVGVSAELSKHDYVMSNHRSHGHYLARGGNINAMFAELYGKKTGCTMGKGGSMHLVDLSVGFMGAAPIVSSTIPLAVGIAFATNKKRGNPVTVIYLGDAATEEGTFHEAINFASLKKLPIVFACENNLYSVYSHLSVRQPKGREIVEVAKAHGVTSWQGNGNKIDEVCTLAKKAIAHARHGKGPVFLELETYRWLEHCGPNLDNDLGYRTPQEFERWKKKCPVAYWERTLKRSGILTPQALQEIRTEIKTEVEQAVTFAKQSAFPDRELAFEHLYAESTPRHGSTN